MNCVGTPISWLRLETYALDSRTARDAGIGEHLAACPACAACLAEIRGSQPELPRLVIPVAAPRRRWRWAVPAMALAAAAVIALVILRPRDPERDDIAYGVKGVGDVVLGVVRERAGTVRDDVLTYRPGDRWKVVVTCPPAATAWLDVSVTDPNGIDYPLAPARIACGNRVVVPGAFTITGNAPNTVCVRISADAAPPRIAARRRDPNVACVTLVPE